MKIFCKRKDVDVVAKCKFCGKDMKRAKSCGTFFVLYKGRKNSRLRVETDAPDGKCLDCSARNGWFHHLGCDQEGCPICGGQITSCGCDIEIVKIEKKGEADNSVGK